jgi:tetratricopeptide (TPR) repeat protein/tRNA A-37 threonylcarbamoyl transferase component Bud32
MHELADTVVAGRYVLERELGRGGMATVWLARDTLHDRRVAIKIVRPEVAIAIGIDRFIREIQLTARLQHPNIAQLLDSGVMYTTDGTSVPWYAMPYLDGDSLRTRLAREQQLSIEDALRITEAVASALLAAHRQGIVHRDVKPENVLFADAGVYVVDFGIAKALVDTGSERLTGTGLSIGTPAYMSPEQTSAGSIDARSDQYSLATVLYEMLTGELPFPGNTQAMVARRFAEPARPLRSARSTIPVPVERAVLRALERVPADRFPDVASFADALRRPAPPDGVTSPQPRLSEGWRFAAGAVLLGVVTLTLWLRFGSVLGIGRTTRDPVILALYQRGLRGYDRRTSAGITDAIAAFSAAIKRDSAYAPAWNGLAKTYVRAYERPFPIPGVSRDSMLALAVTAVQRALAADSGSTDTWVTQSLLSRDIDPTDDKPVVRSLRRAIALDSTNAPAWHWLAMVLAESRDFTGALTAWRRSVTLDPSYTQGLAFLALGHYWRRQYDSASVWADSAIALDPNYLLARTAAGYIAVERGDYDRSVAEFEAARRLSRDVEAPNSLAGLALAEARAGRRREALATLRQAESDAKAYSPVPAHTAVYMAQAYAALGDADQAVAWLERYQPTRSVHFQLHLRCDPPFDSIARDHRFRSLLSAPVSLPRRGC